jgi:hypothetical protein
MLPLPTVSVLQRHQGRKKEETIEEHTSATPIRGYLTDRHFSFSASERCSGNGMRATKQYNCKNFTFMIETGTKTDIADAPRGIALLTGS